MSRLLPWVAAALALLAAAPALAFVRTTTRDTGQALRWIGDCLTVIVHAGEPPADLTTEVFIGAAEEAARTWSRPAVDCTNFVLRVTPSNADSAKILNDKRNNLIFRRRSWCKDTRRPDEPCYDPSALAITTITAQERDGVIIDADIEVNAVNFTWDDLVARGSGGAQDIQNTLTHEFGHLIGMDHNCYAGGDQIRAMDDTGQPVPDCASAPTAIKQATMYAAVIRGDTTRRTLSDDDKRAVCVVYPSIPNAPECLAGTPQPTPFGASDSGCDCTLGAAQSSGGALPPLFALMLTGRGLLRVLRSTRRA